MRLRAAVTMTQVMEKKEKDTEKSKEKNGR
jgi:hypothetical protein